MLLILGSKQKHKFPRKLHAPSVEREGYSACGRKPPVGGWQLDCGSDISCNACRRALGLAPLPKPAKEKKSKKSTSHLKEVQFKPRAYTAEQYHFNV